MSKRLHRQEGFTLIELMIVILIIGILVAIAVPVFLAARGGAENRTCQANRRTVVSATNIYAAASVAEGGGDGSYPTAAQGAGVLFPRFLDVDYSAESACPGTGTVTWNFDVARPPAPTCDAPHDNI